MQTKTLDEAVLLYTTWPDAESAETFAAEAVADRLAACGNVLAPMRSIYRWKGAVERALEHPLLLKTSRTSASALVERLNERHPYDLPCALELELGRASSTPFLRWMIDESSGWEPGNDDFSADEPSA